MTLAATLDDRRAALARTILLWGLFALMCAYVLAWLLNPYLKGFEYGFRADNFWSYSSGIYRRGIVGEIIYWLDLATGIGPQLFSALLYAASISVLIAVGRIVAKEFSLLELALLGLSPIFWLYGVDAEIFMLLPLVGMLAFPQWWTGGVLLASIAIAGLVREISFILYSPVLLTMLLQRGLALRLGVLALVGGFAVLLATEPDAPTFFLENGHWTEHGIAGLAEHGMYQFAAMPFSELLDRHWRLMENGFALGVFFWAAVGLFILTYVAEKTGSGLAVLWLLLVYGVCSILSIDHGRYGYFYFAFALMISAPAARSYFQMETLNLPLGQTVGRIMAPVTDMLARSARPLRIACLFVAVVAPSGLYVGKMVPLPRLAAFAEVALGKLGII